MNKCWLYLIILSTTLHCSRSHAAGSKVYRIRGIPPSKIPLYPPDQDFQCLDGSSIIPFEYVNDDYCDCADGSDEPGTSACLNGSFFCQNVGYQSTNIPSSWVNDGVCDCCDSSDEYSSGIECPNNCHELGRKAKFEAERAAELAREGHKIRVEMLVKGKLIKSELQGKLSKLRVDHDEAELTRKERELLKKEAEEKESIVLEKYKSTEPETPVKEGQEEQDERLYEAEDFFRLLDSDSSGTVTIAELQTKVTFDKDHNGAVSEEEALFFLNNQPEINMQEFTDSAWSLIKPFLMLEKGLFKPTNEENKEKIDDTDDIPIANNEEEGAEEEGEVEEEEEEEEEEGVEDPYSQEEKEEAKSEEHTKESTVQYDEETQMRIDEANQARNRFHEADKTVQELLSEIRKVEEKLSIDYGPDGEFAALDDQCFDYTDIEYIYTLCIFGKATQRAKSGSSEVSLGSWQQWLGPKDDKYSKMKYDRGSTCWNGPARSTIVTLTCSVENKLNSVSEPNRCEYAMEFSTPAVCKLIPEAADTHDEL